MNQKANVADRQVCDFADFLIGQAILEFQAKDFLLVCWKLLEETQDFVSGFTLLRLCGR